MSDSESDLEFESADEGLKGEDIDTDDLIEDEDDVVETKPKQPIVARVTEIPKQNETSLPVAQDKKENIVDTKETKPAADVKTKAKENVESQKKEGWDADVELSDLEDEQKEIPEIKSVARAEQQKTMVDEAKKEVSGWEADADFSDIEDNKEEMPSSIGTEKTGWNVDADFSDVEEEKNNKSGTKLAADEPKLKDIRNIGLFNQTEPKKQESSWSGWGSFGSNFLSTATSLTSQLNSGISTVMETVEATIGAPDPSQLAKLNLKESEALTAKKLEKNSEATTQNDWIEEDQGEQEWFSMGTQLVSGGLDVLETVGRKTFQVISDKDQNLKQTREFLAKVPSKMTNQKPNLSQLLREAKESKSSRASLSDDFQGSKAAEANSFCHYFDEFVGSVHLEALEMLSRQCNVKLEVLTKPQKMKSVLKKLDEFFNADKLNEEDENEDRDDLDADTDSFFDNETFLKDFKTLVRNKMFDPDRFDELIKQYGKRSHFYMDLEKIIKAFRSAAMYTTKQTGSPIELLNESIKCFALITSKIIEFYHKTAECILVEQRTAKTAQNSIDNAESIYQITKLCLRSITIVAEDFCRQCRAIARDTPNFVENSDKSCNQIIADIYLESSNSCTFTSDAYLLLEPVIKVHVLEE